MAEQWRTPFINFSMNCMYALCLPGCAASSARTNYDGSDWLFNFCCLPALIVRNTIRQGYGIQGSCCGDFCATSFCFPCTFGQLLNEIEARGPPPKVAVGQDWSSGLFSCFDDCSSLLYVLFFPQCAMASAKRDYDGSDFCFNCCCFEAALGGSGRAPVALRNIVREGYGIQGSCCKDWFVGQCLTPCAICQIMREIKKRGPVTNRGKVLPQPQVMIQQTNITINNVVQNQ